MSSPDTDKVFTGSIAGLYESHLVPLIFEPCAANLNQPMLDRAAAIGTRRPVQWRLADAMQLPFQDGMLDAVVCQFGVMCFPEWSKAFSEARRVLRPGAVDGRFQAHIVGIEN